MAENQKILVTSALPYVNNVPHLGNLVCVISADVYARFLRLKKENVISICGTDEHGTTTEAKAIEEKLTPKEITDKYFKIHKKIYEWFNCSFDCFGRTSSKENHEITADIFLKLHENGFILEDEIEQFYCKNCDKFLADRFIEGKCPYCNYENARGDQCEKCSKLLNALELLEPKCKTCNTAPEIKKSRHLFIDLPKLEPELREWIKSVEDKWSENAKTMTNAWLSEGLKPRCITRDLKWGIKVPLKGYENKVFYSWFDAPIGYIGITKESRKDWKDWWLDKNTRLVQFMGKDNIPFHTILFPSFLIGTRENYALATDLSVNEFLNYESGQFSKSRGIGIFGDDAIETGIDADIFRYYLMVNRPEKTDTEFSWNDFQAKTNNELVANLGNLFFRVLSFINNFFGSKVPEGKLEEKDKKFLEKAKEIETNIINDYENIRLKDALKGIMQLSKLSNQYMQENEPWKKIKDDEKTAKTSVYVLANIVKDLSILAEPFLPKTSERLEKQLNIDNLKLNLEDIGKLSVKKNHKINVSRTLFKKIEDSEIKKFKRRFMGKKQSKESKTEPSEEFPLDLKIAKIISAKEHPNADKLVVLEIDIGKEKRRIVAGIRKHYSINELVNKKIIVVANLKPAMLRGIKSEGMLLAGDDEETIGLLTADESNPGDAVYFEGMKNSAKEIEFEEFLKIEMAVEDGSVFYKGRKLRTDKEFIKVEKAEDGARVR